MGSETMVKIKRLGRNGERGTVLVLVVVLVTLLAIMGSTFVINSRINLKAVKNQVGGTANEAAVNVKEVEISVDSVISQIKNTLAEDLWGRPEDATATSTTIPTALNAMNNLRLLGLPAAANGQTINPMNARYHNTIALWDGANSWFYNEPWDAPTIGGTATFYWFDGATATWQTADLNVDGDPWLASSEPNGAAWPRASDVLRLGAPYFGMVAFKSPSLPPTNPLYANNHETEAYADADGDGYLDSVWLVQRGFFHEVQRPAGSGVFYADVDGSDPNPDTAPIAAHYNGLVTDLPIKSENPDLAYRMAVRIVDTSGMVNVNTAWQAPNDVPTAAAPDPNMFMGNALSGVNLYNAAFGYGPNDLPGRVAGDGSLANMLKFQNDYIFRIERPDWSNTGLGDTNFPFTTFSPLDLSDEMELRYKWASPGLGYNSTSLEIGNRSSLERYFTHLDVDLDNNGILDDADGDGVVDGTTDNVSDYLKKRTKLTAYSFSRHIRRAMQTESPSNLPAPGPNFYLDGDRAVDPVNALGFYPRKIDLNKALQQWFLRYNGGAVSSQDLFRALPLALFDVFKGGAGVVNGTVAGTALTDGQTSYLVAQYIANLMDSMDYDDEDNDGNDDNEPTVLTEADFVNLLPYWRISVPSQTNTAGTYFVAGLEKHPVITELYAYRVRTALGETSNTKDRYGFEISNPWNVNLSLADNSDNPYYYYSINNGTKVAIEITGSIATKGFIAICSNSDFLDPIVRDTNKNFWVPTSGLTIPATPGGIITLYRRVNRNGTDYDVIQDQFKFSIGDAEPFKSVKKGQPPREKVIDLDGYKWNWVWRDTSNWLALSDNQEVKVDFRNPVHDTPPDLTTPLLKGSQNLGLANTGVDLSKASKEFAFGMEDAVEYSTWKDLGESETRDQEQLDAIKSAMKNPEVFSLTPFFGDIPDGATTFLRPLSYRLEAFARADEKGIRFDYATDMGKKFLEFFEVLGRSSDGFDQNGDGVVDDLDEMRLPGLINVNTASDDVLSALHSYVVPGSITGARPIKSLDALSQDFTATGATLVGVTGDLESQQTGWSRFANLITTRSDTFVAYVLVQAVDKSGKVAAQRREIVLFDRSLCNQPPLIWDATNAKWIENPAYRPVKVVARQQVD
jgi:predicted nucleic acid-binding protein